jgi:hypothetical protein
MYKGWYSQKQADMIGYAIYEDEKGDQVQITEVTVLKQKKSPSMWDDTVCVGNVVKMIRSYWKRI